MGGEWVGGWVDELCCIHREEDKDEAIGMRCCGLLGGGWVGYLSSSSSSSSSCFREAAV